MSAALGENKQKHRERNPVVIQRLRANNTDFSKPHHVVNVFHVFDSSLIEELARLLEARGMTVETRGQRMEWKGQEYWLLEASLDTLPTLDSLDSMTDLCTDIATEWNSDYDGWYTQVV